MATIELQSFVDGQEHPFLVIDKDFRIVAVNPAFERAYGTKREHLAGRHCYEVSHHNSRPCYELGEDCPLRHMKWNEGPRPYSCLHVHNDDHGRAHYVRLKAYPLKGADGHLYMGEAVHDISVQDAGSAGGIRMVGRSRAFLEALEQLRVAAECDAPVLLTGETGTGKELAAGFIHHQSSRRSGPFVTLDCTALTENLFESEVFGHERGAFTGSIEKRKGLFELADGGTLFLDEIGELSPATQAKLLRVLESGAFRRVGGRRVLHANVRAICATNRDVTECVENGRFRADLYYRIACLSVRMPSLRERLEDIPELAAAILDDLNRTSSRTYALGSDALELLQSYDYPGNVRELRNILFASAAHSAQCRIEAADIAKRFNQTSGAAAAGNGVSER
ncbi:MAG TPA: sigma 54-interacting transcriptional regulator, partial [Gammaproteobacteria bacterium]|nr:sigma 54-interacting transcriptional regulator [Gammaproteobacteria bacterium]